MAKVKIEDGHAKIYCPGCEDSHYLVVESKQGSCWSFNNDVERPTFSPSLLVKTGHYVSGRPQPPDCYHCNRDRLEDDMGYSCGICHSFIRAGKIEFLNDCTHNLAGQTVELPDLD